MFAKPLCLISTAVVVAMALGVVGAKFTELWEQREIEIMMIRLRQTLIAHGCMPDDVFEAFAQFDINGSKEIDYIEFRQALTERLALPLEKDMLRKVWLAIDSDGSGSISYDEFFINLFPNASLEALANRRRTEPRPSSAESKLEQRMAAVEERLAEQTKILTDLSCFLRGGVPEESISGQQSESISGQQSQTLAARDETTRNVDQGLQGVWAAAWRRQTVGLCDPLVV